MQEGEKLDDSLDEKLETFKQFLESKELPKVREHFQILYKSFQSISDHLLKKGLIRPDPYKNDRKISEVSAPSASPFLESEKIDQISVRISEYDSQLDFINNYYTFSIDSLDIEKLKKIVNLLNYFKWSRLIDTSSDINTRVLAELVNKIKAGTDKLAIGIINENISRMSSHIQKIQSVFKQLSIYYRETYKQSVRERILYKIHVKPEAVMANQDKAIKLIKQHFPGELPNAPFYPDLIKELILEEYSAQKDDLKKVVLQKLRVEEKTVEVKKEISYKNLLLESILALGGAGSFLETAIQKLAQNNNIIENRKKSFSEKFKLWIQSVIKKQADEKIIELELFDEITGAKKTLKLKLQEFVDNCYKKTRLLFALSNKMSSSYKKLLLADEDYLLDFLNRHINDINIILNKLPPLDTYFKAEAPKEAREKIKGIKIEITGIKNCVVKANQKKHDYVSRREEMEQLKKLGIDVASK